MKIRIAFVANSSSGSFIIHKEKLTEKQLDHIRNHVMYANMKARQYPHDESWKDLSCGNIEFNWWHLIESDTTIKASTFMTNFDLYSFCLKIGVPKEALTNMWHSNAGENGRIPGT
jgi:hypothetical protein